MGYYRHQRFLKLLSKPSRSDNHALLAVTALIPPLFPIWRSLAERGNHIYASELIIDANDTALRSYY